MMEDENGKVKRKKKKEVEENGNDGNTSRKNVRGEVAEKCSSNKPNVSAEGEMNQLRPLSAVTEEEDDVQGEEITGANLQDDESACGMKEELEAEFARNMQRECENGEQLEALQKDIETLKGFKCEFENTWDERKMQQARHQKKQRQRQQQQQQQQQQQKQSLGITRGSHEEGRHFIEGNIEAEHQHQYMTSKSHKSAIQERSDAEMDLIRKLQDNFDRDSRTLREQNNKCMEEIKALTTEKFEQSRHIRELYDKVDQQVSLGHELNHTAYLSESNMKIIMGEIPSN